MVSLSFEFVHVQVYFFKEAKGKVEGTVPNQRADVQSMPKPEVKVANQYQTCHKFRPPRMEECKKSQCS